MSERLKPLLAECWPCFALLRAHAIRPAPLDAVPRHPPSRGPSSSSTSGDFTAAAATALAAVAVGEDQKQRGPGPGAGTGVVGGSHAHAADARNAEVLVGVRDGVLDSFDLVWRPQVSAGGRWQGWWVEVAHGVQASWEGLFNWSPNFSPNLGGAAAHLQDGNATAVCSKLQLPNT